MLKKICAVLFWVLLGSSGWMSLASAADSNFDYGFYLRLRQEYMGDVIDLNSNAGVSDNFFRAKASIWGKLDFNKKKNVSLFVKFTSEPKYYIDHATLEDYARDDIFFDNLYLDLNNIFGSPLSFRIGRQDFLGTFGEGLLIMDGTPQDGSRSFYFNAVKATWKISDNNSLDFVYINDPKTDEFLPIIDKLVPEKKLNSSDEEGFILYSRNKVNDCFSLEPYYIYKTEAPIGSVPDLALNTLGLRAVYGRNDWKLRGEFAREFGEYEGGRNREANGGYLFFNRKFKSALLSPEINAGYVYLSGDDAVSASHEGWDPLFSQFPFLSELYIFTYATEPGAGVAYWTNLQAYRAGVKVNFNPKASLSFCYNYLLANEQVAAGGIFSGDGKERGHLYQATLGYTFNKYIDGLLLAEYFVPGDFYVQGSDDAVFLRWQFQFKF